MDVVGPRTSLLRRFPRLFTTLLALLSLVAFLLAVEIGLRAADYRFSPIVFVRAEGADDHRPFHMGAADAKTRPGDRLTVADPELLWRPNPKVSAELTPEGFRGEPVLVPRPKNQLLIVALGDSNTLGPLNTADHWPGILQDLLAANRSRWRFQVVNAGVYGYTSFQGLRRFRQVLPAHPDIAFFSFGGNDAQPVKTSDARYAERVWAVRRFDAWRLAPPLFHLTWRAVDALDGGSRLTHRVPLADYRRNLEAFVDEAHAAHVVPILLTRPFVGQSDDPLTWLYHAPAYNQVVREVAAARGVPLVDTHAVLTSRPERFVDAMHNDGVGYRVLAEALLVQLQKMGFVDTTSRRDIASALDLSTADERRVELGPGFWLRETRPDGPGGRWTAAEASLTLERGPGAHVLEADLTCRHPRGETRGRIEVNGRSKGDLPRSNGRHRLWLDLGGNIERAEVRFVVESAYRPRDLEPDNQDARRLGVFLHQVRLLDTPFSDALDLGTLEDGHPALVSGFWARERWPDGAGRWTQADAVWRMSAPERVDELWLDLRFQHPSGRTRASVSVDGRAVGQIDEPNGRRLLSFPIAGVKRGTREIRLHVADAFQPRAQGPGSADARTLGVVLHAAGMTGPDSALFRERRAGERWLKVDYTTRAPLTSFRFEVAGEILHTFRCGPGRRQARLDVSHFAGLMLILHAVVDFPPPDEEPGFLLHAATLEP